VKRRFVLRAALPVVAAVSGLAGVAFADTTDPSEFKPSTAGSSSAAPSSAPSGVALEAPIASAAPATTASASAKPSAAPIAIPSASASARPAPKEDDPLVVPEGIRGTLGVAPSEAAPALPPPIERSDCCYPLFFSEHRKTQTGTEHTSVAFPLYYGHTDRDAVGNLLSSSRLYGPFYYRERSALHDVDAIFPLLYFHWRDDKTQTTLVGPFGGRKASETDWDSWIAPLAFWGSSDEGGYFISPPLLTYSKHSKKRAFSIIGGLGFYDRTDDNVDWGVAPFVFKGSNPAKTTSYLTIPPLLTYVATNADEGTSTTLIGPFYRHTTPTTTVTDVVPFFFHKSGPDQDSTTFLLWHLSHDGATTRSAFAPLWYYESSPDSTTLVTPVYTRYRGRTKLDMAGPIVPLWMHYEDPDAYREANLYGPFLYTARDPQSSTLLTPLFGHWETYGVASSSWIFPTLHWGESKDSSFANFYPFVFTGHDGDHRHTVIAPFFWDFESPTSRQTVLFPAFWRFRDEDGVTQLVLNSLYLERTSSVGTAWDYYFLPIFHVGQTPNGNSWDAFFGLFGYKREGTWKQLKLFWTGIDLTPNPDAHPDQPRVLEAPAPVPAGSYPGSGAPTRMPGTPGMPGGMGGGMGGFPR
jgi:hypothetical protein